MICVWSANKRAAGGQSEAPFSRPWPLSNVGWRKNLCLSLWRAASYIISYLSANKRLANQKPHLHHAHVQHNSHICPTYFYPFKIPVLKTQHWVLYIRFVFVTKTFRLTVDNQCCALLTNQLSENAQWGDQLVWQGTTNKTSSYYTHHTQRTKERYKERVKQISFLPLHQLRGAFSNTDSV